jgi:hypothetical protein
MGVRSTAILLTVEYQDAFADLAEIYLEDSWVLDVAATEHGVVSAESDCHARRCSPLRPADAPSSIVGIVDDAGGPRSGAPGRLDAIPMTSGPCSESGR